MKLDDQYMEDHYYSTILSTFENFYNKNVKRNFMSLKNRLLLKIIPKKKACNFFKVAYMKTSHFHCKRLRTYISCSNSQFLPFLFIPWKSKLSFCFPDISRAFSYYVIQIIPFFLSRPHLKELGLSKVLSNKKKKRST